MAITAQTPYNSYTGNGSATVYAYTFKIFADSDLAVYVDGTLKTLTTDYTVSGAGTASGGNVTFGTAPANGLTVLISRAIPYNRTTDYQTNGDLLADTLDDDLDRIVCQVQQLEQGRSDSVSAPFPGGNYTANSRNIENLADPVNAQDADTKAARDAAIVSAMLGSPPNNSITTAMLQDEAVTTAKIDDNSVTPAKMSRTGTAGQVLTSGGADADPSYVTPAVIQQVESVFTNYWGTSAIIPVDDSIPQISEGAQIATVSITPKFANSKLLIEFIQDALTITAGYTATFALFRDSNAGAIAVQPLYAPVGTALFQGVVMRHTVAASSVTATTFQVRIGIGSSGGGAYGNGTAGARLYGGVAATRLKITEVRND